MAPRRRPPKALFDAIRDGNCSRVRGLIREGAAVSGPGAEDLETPLEMAVRLGRSEVARALLEAGAPPDQSVEVPPPFFVAVAGGHVEILLALLAAGCRIDQRHPYSRSTALMHAAYASRPELVRLILELGAEVNATDVDGHSAAMYAIKGLYARGADAGRDRFREVYDLLLPRMSSELRMDAERYLALRRSGRDEFHPD